MAKRTGLGSVKRFGPRYGRTVKNKLAKIEVEQKRKQKCPFCAKEKVSRLAAGIWECRKCESKFAGRAYAVGKRTNLVEEVVSMVAEAPELRVREEVEDEE